MENTGFPDEKFEGIWAWATIFTGISLVLNFIYLTLSNLLQEFAFVEDLHYIRIQDVGLEFFSGFLFPMLSFILILNLYRLSVGSKVSADIIIIILCSFPILLTDYIIRAFTAGYDNDYLFSYNLDIYSRFPIANIEHHNFELQLFLLPSFILLIVNLILLIRIAPYKSGLFRKYHLQVFGSLREYTLRIGRYFSANFHFFYIFLFNLMILLLINKSPNIFNSDSPLIPLVVVILTVPAYTGFAAGFATKNRLNGRILSFILGGLFTIMYPISLCVRYEFLHNMNTNMVIIILLIYLVPGCFIGRGMGMVGYRLRGNQTRFPDTVTAGD